MLLSIIIPVYNSAYYIEDCLNSIFLQGIDDNIYEIILIDDGSTDNSSKIIKEIMKSHENIYYKYQANKGAWAARNTALSLAKGEYIYFVDSDDELRLGALQFLIEKVIPQKPDMVSVDYTRTKSETKDDYHISYEGKLSTYINCYRYSTCTHSNIWLRKLFVNNNIKFDNIYTGEDTALFYNLIIHVKSNIKISGNFYYYRDRANSLYNNRGIDRQKMWLDSRIKMLSLVIDRSHYLSEEISQKKIEYAIKYWVFQYLHILFKTDLNYMEFKRYIKKLQEANVFGVGTKWSKKSRLLGILSNFPTLLYVFRKPLIKAI